jgi:fermentation-respiration switch protein FrsA (DUF1100 family)
MRKMLPLGLLLGAVVAAPAQAAPPAPFGHACTPQNGVLFCPTASDALRVPSFDGVPLDVDVTLPPTGDGPFPTIVMLHGYGGDKGGFETTTPDGDGGTTYHYNNVFYAQQGYAVVNYSARGFGRSCGTPDSRTSPGCDRGWLHLTDHRYEARDSQHLLGLLVDQGVARADALGVTGISYGGIQTHELARLRSQIRLEDGSFAAWTSPAGTPLEFKAAWPRWGGTDLTYALTPNGRFLDFRPGGVRQSRLPLGVMKKSYNDGLYALGNLRGFYAPPGTPGADITTWKAVSDRGEPARPDAAAVARELTNFHSPVSLTGIPAPLLIQNGWTDDLFPVPEALRAYFSYNRVGGVRAAYQFGDLGHARASNKVGVDRFFNEQGAAFFAAHLKGEGTPPAHNSITAFTQTCPKNARAGGPYRARSWEALHPGSVVLINVASQRIRSGGGNPRTGRAFDQVLDGDPCRTVRAERAAGTAIAGARVRKPFTLLGLPTVRAVVRTRGRGGFIAARLFDVFRGRQMLVSRGVYRLADNQRGTIVFQLFGNGWRFRKGHRFKLELLGNDPNFLRTSNFRFSVAISSIRLELPTRERR